MQLLTDQLKVMKQMLAPVKLIMRFNKTLCMRSLDIGILDPAIRVKYSRDGSGTDIFLVQNAQLMPNYFSKLGGLSIRNGQSRFHFTISQKK